MAMGQIDAVNLRGFNGVIGNLRLRRRFAPASETAIIAAKNTRVFICFSIAVLFS